MDLTAAGPARRNRARRPPALHQLDHEADAHRIFERNRTPRGTGCHVPNNPDPQIFRIGSRHPCQPPSQPAHESENKRFGNPYDSITTEFALTARTRKLIRSAEHTSELQPLMRISIAVFCLQKT